MRNFRHNMDWKKRAFHRGNSTNAIVIGVASVNIFLESRTLILLLSITWLSSRKLWVIAALPLVDWRIYTQDSDFATSHKKEGDWAGWMQPNVQCRSKGNISRGHNERQRRELLGKSFKIWNLEAWKCYFQRSPSAICDLRISRIIYLVHCLSKPMHIESITLATSITK